MVDLLSFGLWHLFTLRVLQVLVVGVLGGALVGLVLLAGRAVAPLRVATVVGSHPLPWCPWSGGCVLVAFLLGWVVALFVLLLLPLHLAVGSREGSGVPLLLVCGVVAGGGDVAAAGFQFALSRILTPPVGI